mmetsp:Transcript_11227/g.35639  ORF Transcript_11227/g.35639 Transcript_11227/m.35639 type:complete len:236 (+) Transcript_11227:49-756(+)
MGFGAVSFVLQDLVAAAGPCAGTGDSFPLTHGGSSGVGVDTSFADSGAEAAHAVTHQVFLDVSAAGKALGRITLDLFGNLLPKTVENFVHLAKCDLPSRHGTELCYRGAPFHRVIPGFMVQGGDTTHGDGTGGESIYGRTFPDEASADGRKFPIGHAKPFMLSMANAGPDTNGSQFFITTDKTPWLDGHHVVFGEVHSGQDVVKKIEALGSSSGETSADVIISDSGLLDTGAKFL